MKTNKKLIIEKIIINVFKISIQIHKKNILSIYILILEKVLKYYWSIYFPANIYQLFNDYKLKWVNRISLKEKKY